MAHIGLVFLTLLAGIIIQAVTKPKYKALISFIFCTISAVLVLIFSYYAFKNASIFTETLNFFGFLLVTLKVKPLLAIILSFTALLSSALSFIILITNNKKSQYIIPASFLAYFGITISSKITASISFLLLLLLFILYIRERNR